jgi:hypothetical protein
MANVEHPRDAVIDGLFLWELALSRTGIAA